MEQSSKPLSIDAARKEALMLIELWRERLLLGEWLIELKLETADAPKVDDYSVTASTSVDPTYLNAKMTLFPAYGLRSREKREDIIIHELCHILTQEAWDLIGQARCEKMVTASQAREAIERLTQRIANSVQWQKPGTRTKG